MTRDEHIAKIEKEGFKRGRNPTRWAKGIRKYSERWFVQGRFAAHYPEERPYSDKRITFDAPR